MSKYDEKSLHILSILKEDGGETAFTADEIRALREGEAPLKLTYKADKMLKGYNQYMKAGVSRREASVMFAGKNECQMKHGQLNDRLVFLVKTLVKKGLVTEEEINVTAHEIQAESWPNLCGTCGATFPECGANPKRAADFFNDLPDALAGKVVQCGKFTEKKEEAANASA